MKNQASFFVFDKVHGKENHPFNPDPGGWERFKNPLFPYPSFKKELASRGIDVSTPDINSIEESKYVFCWNNALEFLKVAKKKPGQKWFLIIYDPPMFFGENWDPAYHQNFDVVYTFDKSMVDNKKYFYAPLPVDTDYFKDFQSEITEDLFNSRKLNSLIADNVYRYPYPGVRNSIVHLRYDILKWYGKNYPDEFSFYSNSFPKNNYFLAFRGNRFVQKLLPSALYSILAKFMQRDIRRIYQGPAPALEKFAKMRLHNFYTCFENTLGLNGYIDVKIFDCLYAGVVPIYLGASNIQELIPYKCYVDVSKVDYKDPAVVYKIIKSINYKEYKNYIDEGKRFLTSKEFDLFKVKYFVEMLLRPIDSQLREAKAS